MDDRVWIYALYCPATRQIRYVGKSARPAERFRRHKQGVDNGNARGRWIDCLKEAGLEPSIFYLERVAKEDGTDAENRWMGIMRAHGHELTNTVFRGSKRPEFAIKRRRTP